MPMGLFEYVVMPLGLTNAPATFQRLINLTFQDLLGRSRIIGRSRIKYLRHVLENETVYADPDKVAAVRAWPKPASVKEVQQFMGLANYHT